MKEIRHEERLENEAERRTMCTQSGIKMCHCIWHGTGISDYWLLIIAYYTLLIAMHITCHIIIHSQFHVYMHILYCNVFQSLQHLTLICCTMFDSEQPGRWMHKHLRRSCRMQLSCAVQKCVDSSLLAYLLACSSWSQICIQSEYILKSF